MVGTNASTNKNHKFYRSMVHYYSIVVGDYAIKVGSLCACFVEMRAPVKTQVGNGLGKIFNFGYIQLICLTKPFPP